MKTTLTQLKLLAAAAVLAFAAPTMAAKEGDPTGAFFGAGAAFAELECPSGWTCGDTDTVPYLYLGGMLDENFGLELGYLSKAEFSISPGSGTTGTLEYSALHLALLGRFPFNDNVAVFGKLGAVSSSTSANLRNSAVSVSVFDDGVGVMYGIGLEVQSGNFGGRLEYNLTAQDLGYGGLSIFYRFR